eukprot:9485298-Pyramimonas_sp.AAC.1
MLLDPKRSVALRRDRARPKSQTHRQIPVATQRRIFSQYRYCPETHKDDIGSQYPKLQICATEIRARARRPIPKFRYPFFGARHTRRATRNAEKLASRTASGILDASRIPTRNDQQGSW